MPFTGIANPAVVAELRRIVDRHCLDNHIADVAEREQVAFRVMSLFTSGMSMEDLEQALVASEHRSIGG